MLYQPSTQNPPSNPLSSAQASEHCRRKHYNHLWRYQNIRMASWAPCHRRYVYLLPGWPLFPVPHSWCFRPSLLASRLLPLHTWLPSVAQGKWGGQSEFSETSYPSPSRFAQPHPSLYISIKGRFHPHVHRYFTLTHLKPPDGILSPRIFKSFWLTPSPLPTNTSNLWGPLASFVHAPRSLLNASTLSVQFDESFFFFFGPCCTACGILVPRPGIEPGPSAVRAQSPNYWTTREFPRWVLKNTHIHVATLTIKIQNISITLKHFLISP